MSDLLAIFGAGRNGSTLIMRLLDGAPDLWVHPVDVVYLTAFDDLARDGVLSGASMRTATTRSLAHLHGTVRTAALLDLWRPHIDTIDVEYLHELTEPYERTGDPEAGFDAEQATTAGAFLPAYLEAVRRACDARPEPRLLAFKTSETAYIDEYIDTFPGLRCLHILRDPLTNYASAKRTWMESKRTPFWGGGEDILETFLEARWLPHARTLAHALDVDPNRHHLVRYEDLCADPVHEILGVCDWLGIAPPPEPEIQTVLGGRHMRSLPSNPSQLGLNTPKRVVRDMAAEFGYETIVTPREDALIRRLTGAFGSRFGYDLDARPGSAFSLWLRWLPADSSERLHVTNWARWVWMLLRRRAYISRRLLGW